MGRVAAYPGSFNPLTVAHLALAEAARDQCGLDRVDLVVSRVALVKEEVALPWLEHRMAVLEQAAASRPWLGVVVTGSQLIADLAAGYDAVILGADKWAQVLDPAFYGGSRSARDAAVARLPLVVLARRPPSPAVFGAGSASGDGADPAPGARSTPGPWPESGGSDGAGAVGSGGARTLILEVPAAEGVSSTGARAGRRAWMAPEAREFDRRTGAWSDADRYRRWLARSESEVSVTGDRVAKQASEQRR